jgi:hypothetical protein
MNIIENQASQEELDYFNKHGQWPWSYSVIELYKESINKNPYVRTLPDQSVNYARTIYNQAAILRILSYQSKEGQMLLNGILIKNNNSPEELPSGFGDFPYNSGLSEDKTYDVIKCNLYNNDNNEPSLERIINTGTGGIFGQQTKKIEPVDYNDLENIIPGFTFLNGPCNPCTSMAANPDYSCAYKLNVKNEPSGISSIWKKLWNMDN